MASLVCGGPRVYLSVLPLRAHRARADECHELTTLQERSVGASIRSINKIQPPSIYAIQLLQLRNLGISYQHKIRIDARVVLMR